MAGAWHAATASALVLLAALAGCAVLPAVDRSPLTILDLRCESLVDPLGIDARRPSLSWRLVADSGRGHRQTAYRVQVARSERDLAAGRADMWDSGVVRSDRTVGIAYSGQPLASRTSCFWRVQAWDERGRATPWSGIARFTMGLLERSDWHGSWIGGPPRAETPRAETPALEGVPTARGSRPDAPGSAPDAPSSAPHAPGSAPDAPGSAPDAPGSAPDAPGSSFATADDALPPAPWLRRTFDLPCAPRRALAYVASIGYHELYVNGVKAGDDVLTPSISDLSQRTRYVTRDVTAQLRPGRNALGLWLGVGWAAYERFAVPHKPIVLAELDVELEDGRRLRVVTDASWRTRDSPVSHLGTWKFGSYGGERLDLRRALPGWADPDLDDAAWAPATVYDCDVALVAEALEANRAVELLRPIEVAEIEPGVYRVDMGRSFTGWTELRLRGPPGATISLHTSEREGERTTYGQVSELVLAEGEGTFRHRFNYACGRWITVVGAAEPPRLDEVRGYLVRNSYARAARFACSEPLLNDIQRTVQWTFECLSLGGYVVDCPHRERWGYGGDAHATMDTALDHFALGAFYRKWLADWRWAQDERGNLPHTAPTFAGGGGPAWSGICVMLPWELYVRTGDRAALEAMLPTMDRWLAFLDSQCEGGILQPYFDLDYTAEKYSFLGDWVPPGGQQHGGDRSEETLFFNNAYRVWNLRTAAAAAAALGRDADAARYAAAAERAAHAVHARFYDPGRGVYAQGRQATLALALLAGVAPAALRDGLLARLEHDIRVEREGHLDTGIHGTWMLVRALLQAGRDDLLLSIGSQTTYPSWGHFLAQGATSMWEQWDGLNSRMHSSYLSIGAWFVEGIAGIRPDPAGPGYARCTIRPGIAGGLRFARCELDTVRGPITSEWRRRGRAFELDVTVPVNAIAEVHVPAAQPGAVTEGGGPAAAALGVTPLRLDQGFAVFRVESGRYRFASVLPDPSMPAACLASVSW